MLRKVLLATLASFLALVSAQAGATETQVARLLKPTFQELQSEFVFGEVFTYADVPERLIEQALDAQFHRIEFMRFVDSAVDGAEEGCE